MLQKTYYNETIRAMKEFKQSLKKSDDNHKQLINNLREDINKYEKLFEECEEKKPRLIIVTKKKT